MQSLVDTEIFTIYPHVGMGWKRYVMNKLDRLYKKALQGAKDRHSRELLAQGVEYMGVWSDAMTYCYTNGIEVPEDREGAMDVLRRACVACGHGGLADRFIEWYFDEDNDSIFITMDYGEEGIEYGYPAENGNAYRG